MNIDRTIISFTGTGIFFEGKGGQTKELYKYNPLKDYFSCQRTLIYIAFNPKKEFHAAPFRASPHSPSPVHTNCSISNSDLTAYCHDSACLKFVFSFHMIFQMMIISYPF